MSFRKPLDLVKWLSVVLLLMAGVAGESRARGGIDT